jgi:hypothetical protein
VQRAHHFTGGIKIGCEIIHAKESQRGQQANLPGAMHMSIFLFFNRSQLKRNKNNHNQKTNGKKHFYLTACS